MSIRRLLVLTAKEILHGSRGFVILAVAVPVVVSVLVSLVFGSLFTARPRLGIVDDGGSDLVALLHGVPAIDVREYGDAAALRAAVERGAADMGVVLSAGFDAEVAGGGKGALAAWVWGESMAKNRVVLAAALAKAVRELAGSGADVPVETVALGDRASIPWSDRLLPIVVLITIFLGGIFLPASSVIEEKEKKTLAALVSTPATAGEVFTAKGLVGGVVCLVMGVVILALNRAFGVSPGTLLGIIALGVVMAVSIGLLLGIGLKDVTTLFAVFKGGGIVLFAPGIVYLFPAIPAWIGRLFPTYYLLQPIIEISQRSGGWARVSTDVFILAGIDAVLIVLLAVMLARTRLRQEAL